MKIDEEKVWKNFPAHMATDRIFDILIATTDIHDHLKPGSGCTIESRHRDDLLKLNTEISRRAEMMNSILDDIRHQERREAWI